MGCWNATCGLTGLPIYSGDKVRAMMIARHSLDVAPSYAFSVWTPASMLIQGTYDDYGSVEMTDDQWSDMSKTVGSKHMFYHHRSANDYVSHHRLDFRRDELFDPCEDNMSVIWMCHSDMYDELKTIENDSWREGSVENMVDERREKIVSARNSYTAMRDVLTGGSRMFGEGFRVAEHPIMELVEWRPRDEPPLEVDETAIRAVVEPWLDLYRLCLIMEALRKTLHPTGACGSQAENLQAHRLYNKIVERKISRLMSSREEPEPCCVCDGVGEVEVEGKMWGCTACEGTGDAPIEQIAAQQGFDNLSDYFGHQAVIAAGR